MESYIIKMRHELHQVPEIGFDLPQTLQIIRRELTSMGLPFTEAYGKSSIVATLNDEKAHFTIGIRADIDGLPVTEKNKVPYRSKLRGQMHACGHDAHCAILLDTARRLCEIKDRIDCRVKFLFQPAEEYPPSGAKLMCEDGVMDDIDCIVGLHVDPGNAVGNVNISAGPANAISHGFMLDFYGKSAHAALQQDGVDAIAMAVKAYMAIELVIAKETSARSPHIFNAGSFHGGVTNNCICDHASMYCTLRTWYEEDDERIIRRIKEIIKAVAKESGGRATFTPSKYYPIVYNHAGVAARLQAAAAKVVGADHIAPVRRTLGGEDFSYYLHHKPGCFMRLGVRNDDEATHHSLHQDNFNLDEDALSIGAEIFVQFVLDNMHGPTLEEPKK